MASRHRDRPQDRTTSRSCRSTSCRRCATQILGGEIAPGTEAADRKPADRDLRRQPHGDPRGDRHACRRRAGRGAPGRRRLRARPPDADLRLVQPGDRQQDLARRSTCSKCAWASRSRAPGLRRCAATPRRRRAIQEAFFEFERLLELGEPTGKADFAFHRAIAVGHQQSVLCRDPRRARRPHHSLRHAPRPGAPVDVLTREYQDGPAARASASS